MPVSLTLPTVGVSPGLGYATTINTAIQAAADATHTGGANGDKWTSASLGINADVNWAGFSITQLKVTNYTPQGTIATANSLWVKTTGDLYFTNGSGVPVQLTSGPGLNSTALITSIYKPLLVATNHAIGAAVDYTYFKVDTASPRTITLPEADDVTAGRFYIIQDITGSAASNNITIARSSSDTIRAPRPTRSIATTAMPSWSATVSARGRWSTR